jgi:hypothetical protein
VAESGDSPASDAMQRSDVVAFGVIGVCTVALSALGAWWLFRPGDFQNLALMVSVAVMVLLVLGWFVDRLRSRIPGRAITGLLIAVAVATMAAQSGRKTQELFADNEIAEWNVFHYVLGTKYFPELGFHDFYNGMVLADLHDKERFRKVKYVRDLRTNVKIPREDAIRQAEELDLRSRFSDERWEQCKKDLRAIQRHRKNKDWHGPLNDLGFHPSPAWLVPHLWLLGAVDITRPWVQTALCSSDLWMLLLTLIALGWAFGPRVAALAAIWLHLYFGNSGILVGGYFHYDWLLWTVFAVCLYKKKHPLAAGVVLAYPAMMRGYPGLLAIHPGMQVVGALLRRKMPQRQHLVFALALTLTCFTLVGISSTTRRGFSAWTEWADKIELHSATHPTGQKRIGVKSLYAHDPDGIGWKPSVRQRAQTLEANAGKARTAQLALVAVFLLAMARRRGHDGMLMGLGVVLAALVLSRYYFSVWVLLFTFTALDRWKLGNLLVSLAFFGTLVVYYLMDGSGNIHRYHVFNQLMIALFLGLSVRFLVGDVRDGIAWWRRRSDPARNGVEPAS